MTTSGTATFSLDLNTIVEEAFERCGAELRSGYDLRTARRSLNLLTLEWANRGINLWTVEQGTIPLVDGTAAYNLPVDTIDLVDHVIRTGSGSTQNDAIVTRVSTSTYASYPNKTTEGRPYTVWINRQSGETDPDDGIMYPKATFYPVPDSNDYTFVYWRLRRIQDVGTTGTTTPDIPFRFLPALVSGLAYYLSLKIPDALGRTEMLKAQYEEQWQLAQDEDREKVPLRLVPRLR